jgi:hypothetical protein
MNLYHTWNMEAAAREMASRHHHCVIFHYYGVKPPIRMRRNLIADIPMTIIRSWDSFAKESYAKWREEGGLLVYYDNYKTTMTIEAEAMLYIECPLRHDWFERQTRLISRDVIVYRPPAWIAHERTVLHYNPSADTHRTLMAIINCLVGRDLDEKMRAALELSGFDQAKTAVFDADEIYAMTGISEYHIKQVLKSILFRARYERRHCYTLNMEPEDPDMLWAYKLLEADPDRWKGMRMLRFNRLAVGIVHGFEKQMKRLIRDRCVWQHESVYVVTRGFKEPFYTAIDAVANAMRGDWFKMRNLVDESPEYPITLEQRNETT